jgi:hypothetical protein
LGSRRGKSGEHMEQVVTLPHVLVSYVHTSAARVVREGERESEGEMRHEPRSWLMKQDLTRRGWGGGLLSCSPPFMLSCLGCQRRPAWAAKGGNPPERNLAKMNHQVLKRAARPQDAVDEPACTVLFLLHSARPSGSGEGRQGAAAHVHKAACA